MFQVICISLFEFMYLSLHPRFCSSALWIRQLLLPASFPPALNEKLFVVPGSGADTLLSNDQRRNLTDQQETSQWLGGLMVPKQVLQALTSKGLTYIHLYTMSHSLKLECQCCFQQINNSNFPQQLDTKVESKPSMVRWWFTRLPMMVVLSWHLCNWVSMRLASALASPISNVPRKLSKHTWFRLGATTSQ